MIDRGSLAHEFVRGGLAVGSRWPRARGGSLVRGGLAILDDFLECPKDDTAPPSPAEPPWDAKVIANVARERLANISLDDFPECPKDDTAPPFPAEPPWGAKVIASVARERLESREHFARGFL